MDRIKKIVLNSVIIIFCISYLFPVYIIFINSFKNKAELYNSMLSLPKTFSFQYYVQAMEKMQFLNALKNTCIVTFISIFIIIILSSMTAWIMVRNDNIISKILFMTFVATMLIPFQSIMMPLMQEMGFIKNSTHIPMLDSLGALIYMNVGFGASMAVFFIPWFYKVYSCFFGRSCKN